ncbi:MAG TPA: amidohydrolase family protein, partial [Thermomicrobiales bacterium]|nr:amidohydrolase family protein [Thermomicrobiales bacterium]
GICPMNQDGVAVAAEAFAAGAVGLGEFNADAQGFSFSNLNAFAPLAKLCVEHDRPILIHCSEPLGHDYPGKGTATPDRIASFAESFPELRMVGAHWGGGLPFYELMPEIRKTLQNVSYDSGATTYLYDPSVFRHVLNLVGPRKVLFGSDYPVLGQKRLVASLANLAWADDTEIAAILAGNAIRTYRLEFIS